MALEILKHRERVTHFDYALQYDRIDRPGSGYSFPCDEDGNRIVEQDNPERNANYNRVYDNPDYIFMGIKTYTNSFIEPGEGKCTHA